MKRFLSAFLMMLTLSGPTLASSRDTAALVVGLGLFAAAANAEVKSRRTTLLTRRDQMSFPEMGVEAWARPGEAIYANYNFDEVKILRTLKPVFKGDSRIQLVAGTVFYKMATGKYCLLSGKICKEDTGEGVLKRLGRDLETYKYIDVPAERDVIHLDASSEGFRSELVYLGASKGQLRLAYREFVDDMARPAFTQILDYEITPSSSTRIAFQDLVFEIEEAGNLGIRYRVQLSAEPDVS